MLCNTLCLAALAITTVLFIIRRTPLLLCILVRTCSPIICTVLRLLLLELLPQSSKAASGIG
jgi:hypothetical protein